MTFFAARTNKKPSTNRGFTIIEMIVVISIFAIMAGLVLFRYRDYESELNLEATAQDIALAIQQAQNYAVSGRYPTLTLLQQQTPNLIPTDWRPSYGVYFDAAYPKQFAFFFDALSVQPGDTGYLSLGTAGRGYLTDPSPFGIGSCASAGMECINTTTITNDVSISMICTGDASNCIPANASTNMSIVFTRPFPNASTVVAMPGGTGNVINNDVRIRLTSDNTGKIRDVVITPLGQIRVEAIN